ncbi:MAG: hypothetical protein V7K14_07315, partial [Nostoc sp.]|uniref:hypothetical protein n=1 Tax=Nostoc sp. TaxID=1180 RepID=UPI002FF8312C
ANVLSLGTCASRILRLQSLKNLRTFRSESVKITHSITLATTFMLLVIQVISGKETILFVLEAPQTLQSPTLTKPNIAVVL